MEERILLGPDCIAAGADWLAKKDQRFAECLKQTGPLPTRLRNDGFEALLSAIVGQQISTAAAASIWQRLEEGGLTTEATVGRASEEELRGCGLSGPKVRYAHALAQAQIDYPALRSLPSTEVIKTLTKVKGIGRWSAEIYAMFSLGRADVFAHGDLALQEAARILLELDARPTEKEMIEIAKSWSPWRGVAARLLWAYYRIAKNKEGIRA